MNGVSFKALLFALSLMVVFACGSNAIASQDCDNMHIGSVATSPYTDSGVAVHLRNDNGSACGNLAAGAETEFYISSDNTDRTLAILLTAMSLNKKVWVQISGDANQGDLINVVSMMNW